MTYSRSPPISRRRNVLGAAEVRVWSVERRELRRIDRRRHRGIRRQRPRRSVVRRAVPVSSASAMARFAVSRPRTGASSIIARSAKTTPRVAAMLRSIRSGSTLQPLDRTGDGRERRARRLHDVATMVAASACQPPSAALVFLHHARTGTRTTSPGRRVGRREHDRAARPDCACAASSTIRRPVRTLRRPRAASAARCRARSCRAFRRRCRRRRRAPRADRGARATGPRAAAGPARPASVVGHFGTVRAKRRERA